MTPEAAKPQPQQPLATGKILHIDLPASASAYDIVVGDNVLSEAGSLINLRLGKRRCVIVSDRNVAPLYQQRLIAVMATAGHEVLSTIIVTPGEASKDFNTLQSVLGQIFQAGADRKTLIIALGGGVVGDLAGIAAALALRGMDVVQIPTTLLAQVDSSVGGKTGINSPHGKNTIGAFYQPQLVLADVSTLDSLPDRELRAGYAEVVKYGLIADADFFAWCQAHGTNILHGDRKAQIYAVGKSCEHKARIVASDERESGARALLNFGHTFGHALETSTGYSSTLLHGEGVAIGMVLAFRLSAQLGLCPVADARKVEEHFQATGLPTVPPKFAYDIERLMELMGQDKKAERGKLTLILTRGIGKAFVSRDVNPSPIRELWRSVIS